MVSFPGVIFPLFKPSLLRVNSVRKAGIRMSYLEHFKQFGFDCRLIVACLIVATLLVGVFAASTLPEKVEAQSERNLNLGSLSIADQDGTSIDIGTIDPTTRTYSADVASTVAQVTVSATPESDSDVYVYVSPRDSHRNSDGHQVNLKHGENIIIVGVHSYSVDETLRVYSVEINRAGAASQSTGTRVSSSSVPVVREGSTVPFLFQRSGDTSQALTISVDIWQSYDTGLVEIIPGIDPVTLRNQVEVEFSPGYASARLDQVTTNDSLYNEAFNLGVTVVEGTGYSVSSYEGSASTTIWDDDYYKTTLASLSLTDQNGTAVAFGEFDPDQTSYTADVASEAAHLTVAPFLTQTAAWHLITIVLPSDGQTEADGHQVALNHGVNLITVVVMSPDWDDKAIWGTYSVSVTRAGAPSDAGTSTVGVYGISKGKEGNTMPFVLTRTGDTSQALTVPVDVSETGGDMVPQASKGRFEAEFLAGSASADFEVPTNADQDWEEHSTITVALVDGDDYDLSSDAGSASSVVADDDVPDVTASFSVDSTEVQEGDVATVTITVKTDGPKEPHDYVGNLSLSIEPGTVEDEEVRFPDSRLDPEHQIKANSYFRVSAHGRGMTVGHYLQPVLVNGLVEEYRYEMTVPVVIVDDERAEGDETFDVKLEWSSYFNYRNNLSMDQGITSRTITIPAHDDTPEAYSAGSYVTVEVAHAGSAGSSYNVSWDDVRACYQEYYVRIERDNGGGWTSVSKLGTAGRSSSQFSTTLDSFPLGWSSHVGPRILGVYCGDSARLVGEVPLPSATENSVERPVPGTYSSQPALTSLTVSPGTLGPAFNNYGFLYSVLDVPDSSSQITLNATARSGYTISWDPSEDADAETDGHQVDLAGGYSSIFVSADHDLGVNSFTYEVIVKGPGSITLQQQEDAAATGSPTISGIVQVGQTLTASTLGIADSDGLTNASYTYQWVANDGTSDSDIAYATANTHTLVTGDVGKTIKVKVTFTDDGGNEEILTSAATTAVAATVPGAPVSLSVSVNDTGKLDLSWGAPDSNGGSDVTGYKVQWKEAADSWDTLADVSETTVAGTSHTVSGLTDGVEYTFRVLAVNSVGDSTAFTEESGTSKETTAPTVSSATVDGATLTLTLSEDLTESPVPATTTFTVTANQDERGVDSIAISGSTVALTLASAATADDQVRVSYIAPTDQAAARLRDLSDNPAESFSDQEVTNNTAAARTPLTAAIHDEPDSHDGQTEFTFELRFNEDVTGLSYKTLRDHAFTVTGGEVKGARRLEPGKNIRWEIKISPTSSADVVIVLPITTDCDADGAVCTGDGGKLSNRLELTVSGLTSQQSSQQQQENSPATGSPTISGTVQVGQTLTVSTSGISDTDGLTNASYTYQWIANDGISDSDIQDATLSTYTLVSDDVGKTIKVKVSFTDDAENEETLTSAATDSVVTVANPIAGICDRTEQVQDAILGWLNGVDDCADVTDSHLAMITIGLRISGNDPNNRPALSLKSGDFAGLVNIGELIIFYHTMDALPEDVFDGLGSLERLNLGYNDIAALPEDVFDGLGSLEILDLSDNDIAALPEDVFDGLGSLERLDLGDNDIAALPEDVFDGLGSLKSLDLGGNQLGALPEGVFDGLGSLESLELFGNRINALPEDVFDGLGSLTFLRLSFNRLSALPDDVFDDLGNLVHLNMQENQIGTLPEGVYNGLSSLERLDLSYNEIAALPEDVFDGLGNLKSLRLDSNDLASPPEDVFDGLDSLTHLTLSHNRIHTLPEDVFEGLGNLTSLALHTNQISVLPEDVFDELGNLTSLALDGNQLGALPEGVFDELGNLTSLGLSGNQIRALPGDFFDELGNLTSLGLGSNLLGAVPEGFFGELGNLTYLGLSRNQIRALPEDVFDGLSNLNRLDLSENRLGALPEDVFDGLGNLNELYLYGNQLSALPEDVFGGLSNLNELYLYGNQLNALPEDVFDGLSNLNILYLWGNPGAPFTLTADLERQGDNAVLVKVAEGVPFDMEVTLSATGGTLSAASVTIKGGTAGSEAVTVTRSSDGPVTVSVASAVFQAGDYNGIQAGLGEPLILGDAEGDNRPATGTPAISDAVQVGETLTVDTSGIADEDGLDNVSYSYQWLSSRDTEIDGATGSTYTLQGTDLGKIIKVRVTFTDDAGNEETLTSAATDAVEARPNSPATGDPTISGTAQVGETLTADASGIADEDGLTNATFAYQWLADGADITGATGVTYIPVAADEGKAMNVRVTFTDDAGSEEELTSTITASVAAKANTPATGAPTIGGTVQVGETLTADTSGISDADGLTNVAYSYQWLSSRDSEIAGATSATYTLVDDDGGKAIKVRVSFTDDAGNDEQLTSAVTGAVVAADVNPPLTASVHNVPSSHNGQDAFIFELRFGEAPEPDFSYRTVWDHAFTVTEGSVTYVRRLEPGKNVRWEITVTPDSSADVAIALNATTDCEAVGAICTSDGKRLSASIYAIVSGPVPVGTVPVAVIVSETTPVAEGATVSFTINLNRAAPTALSVAVSVADAGGVLAVAAPRSVAFATSNNSKTITLPTRDDNAIKTASTVTVSLATGSGYTLGTATSASVSVTDNDTAVWTVSAQPTEIAEGGSSTITLAVANGKTFAANQTVSLAVSGTASGSDYSLSATELTLPADASSVTATLTARDDASVESDETVIVTATHDGQPIGSATVTIEANDVAVWTVSVQPTEIAEGGSSTITLAVANGKTFAANQTVSLAVSGTASGSDYSLSATELTLPAGASSVTATLTARDDTSVESDETVIVTATHDGQPIGSATVTIEANDVAVWTVSVQPTEIAEGGSSTITLAVANGKTFAANQTVSLAVSGTASGSDYSLSATELTLPAGASSVTATLTARDDANVESDETVIVTATHDGQPIGSATVTIEANDVAVWTVSVQPTEIAEGGSSTITLAVANGKTFAANQTVSLAVSGTASGSDYSLSATELTLPAGASSVTATLTARDDANVESDETVIVTATHDGQPIGSATVTIEANDVAVWTVSVQPTEIAEGGSSTITLAVANGKTFAANQTVSLAVSGTASGSDYSLSATELTLPAGASSVTATLTARDDANVESDETVIVTATHDGQPIGSATVTIEANDVAVWTVSVQPTEIAEGGSSTITLAVANGKTFAANQTVSLAVSGTASGSDYSLSATELALPADASSVTATLTARDDASVESDETVIGTATHDGQPIGSATVTIEANDVAVWTVSVQPTEIAEGGSSTITLAVANGKAFAANQTVSLAVSGTASGSDYSLSATELTLPADASSVTATLTARDDASVESDETVIVTATHDGQPIGSATVTIEANDVPLSNDATLSTLSLSGIDIGAFSSGTTDYSVIVEYDVASTTVTADPNDDGASVAVADANGVTYGTSRQVSLSSGDNEIIVTVTAEDENAMKVYTVTVTRSEPDVAWGERLPDRDIVLDSDAIPTGLWADDTNAWVISDCNVGEVAVYALSDGSKQDELSFTLADWSGCATALWSNGATLWVADFFSNGVRAYRLSDGARQSDQDLDRDAMLAAGNTIPSGLWSNGEIMWVADHSAGKVFAYRLSDWARVSTREFDLTDDGGVPIRPFGLWSNGETLLASNWNGDRVLAFDLSDGQRQTSLDIDTSASGTRNSGIWSDGETLWIVDDLDKRIYAYAVQGLGSTR